MGAPDLARAFNKLRSGVQHACDQSDPEVQRARRSREEEAALQDASGPVTAENCIPRVLQAWKDGDYFRLLGLPPVEVDALGRPLWQCTDADVSRAYRKLSVFVHPDKLANRERTDAREAFERLNAAHRILKDPAKRKDEMSKRLDEARAQRTGAEGGMSFHARVALNAQRVVEAQGLRAAEGAELHSEFLRQARERRAEAQRKRQRKQKQRPEDDEGAVLEEAERGGQNHERHQAQAASDSDDDVVRALGRMRKGKRRR